MSSLGLLKQDILLWNQWRAMHDGEPCPLPRQNLSNGYFFEGNFSNVDLSGTVFTGACLVGANFQGANLQDANLQNANLQGANFQGANLRGANLKGAYLDKANLDDADVRGADFSQARLTSIPPEEPQSEAAIVPEAIIVLEEKETSPPSPPLFPTSKSYSFPWLKTAIASFGTSVASVAALIVLAYLSETFVFPSSPPGATAQSNPPSKAQAVAAEQTTDAETNTRPEISINSPLALTTSIAEDSVVWAIATYTDPDRNVMV